VVSHRDQLTQCVAVFFAGLDEWVDLRDARGQAQVLECRLGNAAGVGGRVIRLGGLFQSDPEYQTPNIIGPH